MDIRPHEANACPSGEPRRKVFSFMAGSYRLRRRRRLTRWLRRLPPRLAWLRTRRVSRLRLPRPVQHRRLRLPRRQPAVNLLRPPPTRRHRPPLNPRRPPPPRRQPPPPRPRRLPPHPRPPPPRRQPPPPHA